MGDLFDEFMRELRRRRSEAEAGKGTDPRNVTPDDGSENADPDPDPDSDRPQPLRRPDRPAGAGGTGRGTGETGGNRRTTSAGGPRDGSPRIRPYLLVPFLVFSLLALLIFGRGLIELWTDVLWHRSVGYESVLWTRLGAQSGLFALGAVLAAAVLLGNLWLAGRLATAPPDGRSGGVLRGLVDSLNEAARASRERNTGTWGGPGRPGAPGSGGLADLPELPSLAPVGRVLLAVFAVLVVLGVAGALAGAWETILLWQNRVPFSPDGTTVPDPVFNLDISFFLFELPFLRLVQGVIVGLLVFALVIAAGRYLLATVDRGLSLTVPVRLHLGVLAGLALLAMAWGYQLDKLDLAYSTRGVAVGVSYADANAQFFAFDLLTVLSGVAAILVAGGAVGRVLWPAGAGLALWFLASILVGRLYPEAIQRFVVDPNQLAQERPYIVNNISMTRLAFGFDNPDGSAAWDDTRRYNGDQPLPAQAIEAEEDTFRNARLWDYRPLGQSLDQLQTIRRYYDFHDVDTDRYTIDGVTRQVMLSARELDLAGNPRATGFVNQRIIFTHGVGVAMVPVNEVANEGQPRLFIRNLPPVSADGAPAVTEPRIYFGERSSDYVVTGAKQAEFDYPRGGATDPTDTAGVETRWQGTTGISLDSGLNRLLFAIRFGDLDLLISDQVQANSQLLFHRSLSDRVPRIAPFLEYDKDPYVVIDGDGRLVYLWDAYTVSDRFPHADWFSPADLPAGTGLAGSPFNYIRNSVKVSIDAYDGTMRYYVADDADPLIRAWQRVFPDVFRSMSELSPDLAAHLRVPEEQFNVQSRVYGRYHVRDPGTFFQSDDLWTIPAGQSTEQSLPNEAYYVIMRMPGEAEAEFVLIQPMVPVSRPNMISWVAARNDAPNYGKVRVYNFPADTTVFGPVQIEARIDQDPQISAQFTLWRNTGSEVIRGNLIVVPVGDTLLYLQPVYLQSRNAALPEFQRIIVASATEVVWAPTLGESLELLLEAQGGGGPGPSPTPGPAPSPGASPAPGPSATPAPSVPPGPDGLPTDVAGLIAYANEHFELAQQALRDGDFGRYGEEIALVEAALQRLDELAGTASPAPSP